MLVDLLAVPEFMAGAMEDWGLVSFRGAYLVFDEEVMTPESLRQVTLVIAHELAHQVSFVFVGVAKGGIAPYIENHISHIIFV